MNASFNWSKARAMIDTGNPTKQAWKYFEEEIIEARASAQQRAGMWAAFMCGANFIYALMIAMIDGGSEAIGTDSVRMAILEMALLRLAEAPPKAPGKPQ